MILLSAALASPCTQSTVPFVVDIQAPAVVVLGERMGMSPDVPRAAKIVKTLKKKGPVTLGVQIVPAEKQPVLDRFNKGELPAVLLESELHWTGFPYAPYSKLFATGVPVHALGVPVEPKPDETPVPLPRGYARFLTDGMSGHPMPADLESDFAQLVAWIDMRVALQAIESWNGEGFLVILADRAHVEGGQGVSWQAQRLTEAPVHTVLLSGAGACYQGDTYL